ncbi:hypothetical protein FQR65_LT18690 [Abscondita terminalis]|nr:hypothetical protein FQR65_LT18690 [Abscondita terminalis]
MCEVTRGLHSAQAQGKDEGKLCSGQGEASIGGGNGSGWVTVAGHQAPSRISAPKRSNGTPKGWGGKRQVVMPSGRSGRFRRVTASARVGRKGCLSSFSLSAGDLAVTMIDLLPVRVPLRAPPGSAAPGRHASPSGAEKRH